MSEALQQIYQNIDKLLMEPGVKIVAIDGNSAAGKSSFASLINKKYQCSIFHMDDFFLPEERKTRERLKEAGGNVDRERFKNEIIEGILGGHKLVYRKFDCKTQTLGIPIKVLPTKLNIVEGVYSMHPELSASYNLKIFMSVPKEEQSHRILLRNGPSMHKKFLEEWIPLEDYYFSSLNIREKCDYILELKNFCRAAQLPDTKHGM